MHEHLQAFVQSAAEAFELRGPVYKFGFFPLEAPVLSLHGCFPEMSYVGCNFTDPEELGRMDDLAHLPLADAMAGTVVALNLLERVADARQTVEEMVRVLAPGGALLIASSPEDRRDAHPRSDILRPDLLARLLNGLEVTLVGWRGESRVDQALYAVGFKAPAGGPVFEGTSRFLERFQRRLDRLSEGRRLPKWLAGPLGRVWPSRQKASAPPSPVRFLIDLPGICQGKLSSEPVSFKEGTLGSRLDLMEE
jgi:SAM-dependent methyltransferase